MKTMRLLPLALVTLSTSAFAQFSPGNLAVLRVGNGVETLTSSGNSVFIDQYTISGGFVNSVAMPNSGANSVILSGNRTAEGWLALSADGQYLTYAGYNANLGGTDLQATTSASVPRAIGMVDMLGNASKPISTSTAYSGQSWRSAVTDGSGNYWGVGVGTGNGGPYYMGGGTPVMLQSTATLVTLRAANIFNGNLYFSSTGAAGGGPGIYGFSGMPTTAGTPTLLIPTGASAGTTDFAINSAGNLAYIADDRSVASGGGIQKWTFDGSTWTLAYTLLSGSTSGARGLAVDFTGANPLIYATTGEGSAGAANKIVAITDTGIGSAATIIATAGTGQFFRGLEILPVPEPSTLVLAGLGAAALLAFRRRK